jgi:N-acetylmuramoyl-L-alanine amidase
MRKITEIIVHCTATRADWWASKRTSDKVREIKRWHTEKPPGGRGWADIGYHFLIDRDGTVAKGRDIARDGAHVQGHNAGTIGISLFGGHGSAETDQFADNFTPEQDAALRSLIGDLRKQYGNVPVTGHNQYAAKACPGFNAPAWFARKPTILRNPQIAPAQAQRVPQAQVAPDLKASSSSKRVSGGAGILAAIAALSAAGYWVKDWIASFFGG